MSKSSRHKYSYINWVFFSEEAYTSLFFKGLLPQVHIYIQQFSPYNVVDAYDLACIYEFEFQTKFKVVTHDFRPLDPDKIPHMATDVVVVVILDAINKSILEAAKEIKHSSHTSSLDVDIVISKESAGNIVPGNLDDQDTHLLASITRRLPIMAFDNAVIIVNDSISTARSIRENLQTSSPIKDGYISALRTWLSDTRDVMQPPSCYSRSIKQSSRCFNLGILFFNMLMGSIMVAIRCVYLFPIQIFISIWSNNFSTIVQGISSMGILVVLTGSIFSQPLSASDYQWIQYKRGT